MLGFSCVLQHIICLAFDSQRSNGLKCALPCVYNNEVQRCKAAVTSILMFIAANPSTQERSRLCPSLLENKGVKKPAPEFGVLSAHDPHCHVFFLSHSYKVHNRMGGLGVTWEPGGGGKGGGAGSAQSTSAAWQLWILCNVQEQTPPYQSTNGVR